MTLDYPERIPEFQELGRLLKALFLKYPHKAALTIEKQVSLCLHRIE